MQRFVEQHPRAVSPESVSMGWAHTYVGRGDVTLWKDNDWSGAYRDYLRALRYRPGYRRAWRAMLRGVVTRHPPRNPSELRSDLSKNENLIRKLGRKLTETLIPALPRVMMYHRFSREPQFRRIDSKVFREQVIYLQNNFDLVPFSTLVQAYQERQFGRSRLAAITIDDAYHDVWDIAYPILHELGAPAIVYVPTDFVDRGTWLWPDLLDYMLRATRSPSGTLRLEGADELRRPLGSEAQLQSSWNDFADHLFAATPQRRENALNELARSLNVEVPANPTNRYLPLTWAQLRSMHATGIEIGSHTCSHPRLSQHTASQQLEELRRSKTVIEQQLGVVVEHFCYPYGAVADISDQSPTLALQAGYRSAVVSYHDGQRFTDPFQIRRISAPASGLAQLERATNAWRLVIRGARDKLYFR
jgi:peptidoglycan/xylan/chitin deacetylase (PgdA/CDA1 family)